LPRRDVQRFLLWVFVGEDLIGYAVECGYVVDLCRYGRKIFQNASAASSRLPISRAPSLLGDPVRLDRFKEADNRLIELAMKLGSIEAGRVVAYCRRCRGERITAGREKHKVTRARQHVLLRLPWQSLPDESAVPQIRRILIPRCAP